ncbi:hypothetical protein ACFQNE_03085 [Gordonia phosphorivorans]|uniref:Uncharacterized protein n=1 Tax=Gordonia phosphorivorans TaxID=1056982 RepID=A0ABV6H6H2_9ACTN
MDNLVAAIEDINTRSATAPPPADPVRPEPLDSFALTSMGDDELEALWQARTNDPFGQELIEREWSRRDMHARTDVDSDDFPFTSYKTLVDRLHEPEELSDELLKDTWLDAHVDPQLRALVETEMDRRMLERTESPIDDPQLQARIEERIDWSYENMSPTQYRRYHATVVTDPQLRAGMPKRIPGRPTERELKQDYHEFTFERYLAIEDHTRGHMLNARGQALGVDPFTLLSGNAKRAQAYGSEEFLGFLGAHGGHMPFARFKALRLRGVDYDDSKIESFNNATHAVLV